MKSLRFARSVGVVLILLLGGTLSVQAMDSLGTFQTLSQQGAGIPITVPGGINVRATDGTVLSPGDRSGVVLGLRDFEAGALNNLWNGDWILIQFADGTFGWVASLGGGNALLTPEQMASVPVFADDIIAAAVAAGEPVPTPTPIPTPTPSPTPVPVELPAGVEEVALAGVTTNADWEPIEHDFDGTTMVLVPAGSFEMGSTTEEIDYALELCSEALQVGEDCATAFRFDLREQPTSIQAVAEPFWIDVTEVTAAMYTQCVTAGDCQYDEAWMLMDSPDFAPELPMSNVTWFQANEYCAAHGGRLPTTVEWEYAARGPDRLIFPWGNSVIGDAANHADVNCSNFSAYCPPNVTINGVPYRMLNLEHDDGYYSMAPAASYPNGASWVGALNLSGNVEEWTSSLVERNQPYDAVESERDTGDDTSVYRIVRGGSYTDATYALRGAWRTSYQPDRGSGDFGLGFRCARDFE